MLNYLHMTSFLFSSLAFFFVWLMLLLFSESTRREQLIMSVVGLVLSPGVLLIAATDYRQITSGTVSAIGVEDMLFAFSLFGIAAVIYHVLLGKHTHKLRGPKVKIDHAVTHWLAHLILVLGLWIIMSLLLLEVFGLSSVQSGIVGGLLIATYIIAERQDLLFDALLSGVLVAALVFIVEHLFFARMFPDAASNYWQFENLSTFVVGGIPIEELMWAAVVGLAIGPMYEWLRRYALK